MNKTQKKKDLKGGFSFFKKTIKNRFSKRDSSSLDKQEKIVMEMLKISKKLNLSSEEKNNVTLTKQSIGKNGSAVYFVDIKNDGNEVVKSYIYKQSSYKQRSAPREFINSDILSTQLNTEFQKFAGDYYPFPKVYDKFMMNNGVTFAMFFDKFSSPRYVDLNEYFNRETTNIGMVVNVILNLLFILYVIHQKFPFFQHQDMHPQNIFIDTQVEKKINLQLGNYEINIIPNVYLIDFDLVVGLPSFAYSPPLKNRKVSMAFSEMCGSVTHKVVKDFMVRSPISLYNLSDYEFINSIYICLTKIVSKNDKNVKSSIFNEGFVTKKVRDLIKRKKAEILCSEYGFIPYELNNIISNQSRSKSNNDLYNSIFVELKEKYGFGESIHVISNIDEQGSLEDSAPLQVANPDIIADLMKDDSLLDKNLASDMNQDAPQQPLEFSDLLNKNHITMPVLEKYNQQSDIPVQQPELARNNPPSDMPMNNQQPDMLMNNPQPDMLMNNSQSDMPVQQPELARNNPQSDMPLNNPQSDMPVQQPELARNNPQSDEYLQQPKYDYQDVRPIIMSD